MYLYQLYALPIAIPSTLSPNAKTNKNRNKTKLARLVEKQYRQTIFEKKKKMKHP